MLESSKRTSALLCLLKNALLPPHSAVNTKKETRGNETLELRELEQGDN